MHKSVHLLSLDQPSFGMPQSPPHRRRLRTGAMRISSRLSLIIAVCLLPVVGLQVAVSWSQWAERKAQLGDLAMHQAELLAGDVESIAGGRAHPARRGGRSPTRSAPEARTAAIAWPGCGATPPASPSSPWRTPRAGSAAHPIRTLLDDRDADLGPGDAAAARGFTAGRFTRLPAWPGGVLPFYLPSGRRCRAGAGHTLIAALDLGWLERHLIRLKRAGSPFLANGVLTVADADGVILGRDTRHAEFVGKPFPPAAMPLLRAAQPGILRLRSIDGTDRVVGYTPPTPDSHGLSAVVGFHEPELMGDIERALLRGGAAPWSGHRRRLRPHPARRPPLHRPSDPSSARHRPALAGGRPRGAGAGLRPAVRVRPDRRRLQRDGRGAAAARAGGARARRGAGGARGGADARAGAVE